MKKFLFLMVSMISMEAMHAQYYTFLTLGYNGGRSNSMNVVNNFVKDYNSTRTYLTQQMNPQDFIQGFTGSWGFGNDGLFLDVMYTNKYSLHSASGTPLSASSLQRRDVRFTYNSLSFCMYFLNFKRHSFRGPGLSVDFGRMKQKTRYGDAATLESQDFAETAVFKTVGLTLCYDFKIKIVKGVFLGFRPYYQILKSEADIYPIAKAVNNGYSGSATKLRGGNYGIQVNLAFGTYHYN